MFRQGVIKDVSLGYHNLKYNEIKKHLVPKDFHLPLMKRVDNPNPFFKKLNQEKFLDEFGDLNFGTFGFDRAELTKIKTFNIHTLSYTYKPIAQIKFNPN